MSGVGRFICCPNRQKYWNVYPTRDTKMTLNRCQQAREAWALHVSGTYFYIYHKKSHRPPHPPPHPRFFFLNSQIISNCDLF